MIPSRDPSRRTFLTSTLAMMATGPLIARADARASHGGSEQLAMHGGERAVSQGLPPLTDRWGDLEREQLSALIDQPSLFYWNNERTRLAIERFKRYTPLEYVMTCSSGTAALHIAVAAAGVGPGDEVITTPITDIGTVVGILFQQGVPVFADLEPNSYNLDPEDVVRRITPKTKAIIPVHLFGNPCNMTALREIADEHGLALIEDAAQAWGARHRGKTSGIIGDITCYSLMNSKHITTGDGGVVASNHQQYGPRLLPFGDKGMNRPDLDHRIIHGVFATNYRMSEAQAAILAAQLERLEGIAEKRARLGTLLSQEISGLPGISPHGVDDRDRCTFWFYMFRLRLDELDCDRSEFISALQAEGLRSMAGYIGLPLYQLPMFQDHSFFAGQWPVKEMGLTSMDYRDVQCPEAEAILADSIRLHLHEGMDEEYIRQAGKAIRKVARHYAKT